MSELAPIVLFVYNRPWHTEQTLEALSKNELAAESVLYIFADGPKPGVTEEVLINIEKTRAVLKSKKWCKEVHILESNVNKGLADSIVGGVTEVINRHNKVIVLEDDIVTSVGFLKFMNKALSVYEHDENVMHVSGYMYPVSRKLPATVFLNVVTPWGWATWARAWRYFDADAGQLMKKLNQFPNFNQKHYNRGYGQEFYNQLKQNAQGFLKTWAVKWHTVIFLQSGFCLHPGISLTRNIGFDGSGENCAESDINDINSMADDIVVDRITIKELPKVLSSFSDFYKSTLPKAPLKQRMKTLAKKIIKKLT